MADTAATVPMPGKNVTKAVIPAAGLGTRFLPATKATPKEMLPVVDKPAIQYVVEEAVAAGLDDVLMITGRSKRSIEDHFDRAYELEEALAAKEDIERLAQVRESSELATVHYVRQGDPKGLGHAVLCAAQHVGDEPFAVLLGDDIIDSRDPLLTRMIKVRQRYGGSIVALMEVDPEQVSQYGCAAISPTAEEDVVTVTDLVEKPVPGAAPSNWILIGRYVCDPAVFDVLRETPPGRGGEIQRWPSAAPPRAAACTACCSTAAATTPATSWTTCAPWSSSPASAPTWPRRSYPGCVNTWTASHERYPRRRRRSDLGR